MWSINKYNEIRMTKGDTPFVHVTIYVEIPDGEYQEYIPAEEDQVIFAVGGKGGTIFSKEIPHDTMTLFIAEEDTGSMEEGEYSYEISLNSGAFHCTFVPSTRFILTTEIYSVRGPVEEMNPEEDVARITGVVPAHKIISANVSLPGIMVDPTLTRSGQAADAKKTGQELAKKYTLPEGGIPEEDLSDEVKEKLGVDEEARDDVASIKEDLLTLDSTKVGYSEVVNNQLLMYSDDTKSHLLATLDLPSGGNVKINGVETTDNNVPIANANYLGAVKTSDQISSSASTGVLAINDVTDYGLQNRSGARAITVRTLDKSVTAVLTDGKAPALTEAQQESAQSWLGIRSVEGVDF